MEGQPGVRGRGFKVNGASQRPHSRNKQWVALGYEGSHGSEGERWERGGGPWRGIGRGRGRGRGITPEIPHSASHPAVLAVNDDAASGMEDEAMTDVEDVEAEVEVEEKDPETPEERERFYQEVCQTLRCYFLVTYLSSVGQSSRAGAQEGHC